MTLFLFSSASYKSNIRTQTNCEHGGLQAAEGNKIMIKKVGNKFVVVSHKGKRLSKPVSKAGAKRRLKQVEWFKHKKK